MGPKRGQGVCLEYASGERHPLSGRQHSGEDTPGVPHHLTGAAVTPSCLSQGELFLSQPEVSTSAHLLWLPDCQALPLPKKNHTGELRRPPSLTPHFTNEEAG